MATSVAIHAVGMCGHTVKVQIVGDHYAVMRDGLLFGTVEKFDNQWTWNPLRGNRMYCGTASSALRQATQEAENTR